MVTIPQIETLATFAARLRKIRRLTFHGMYQRSGNLLSPSFAESVETGRVTTLTPSEAELLAAGLGIKPDHFEPWTREKRKAAR